jgi:hypothetical protein
VSVVERANDDPETGTRWAKRRDHSVFGGAVITVEAPERTRNVEIDAYLSRDIQ